MPSKHEKEYNINGTKFLVAGEKTVICGSGISRGYEEVDEVIDCANFVLSGRHFETRKITVTDPPRNDEQSGEYFSQSSNLAPTSLILVGYSYGALIAGSASANLYNCIGYVLISAPLDVKHWLLLFNSRFHIKQSKKRAFPRLLMQGSKDVFSRESSFHALVDSFPRDTSGAVIDGVDHFYHGKEANVTEVIEMWILEAYPQLKGDLNNLKTVNLIPGTLESDDFDMRSMLAGDDGQVEDDKSFGIMNQLYECAVVDTPCRSSAF